MFFRLGSCSLFLSLFFLLVPFRAKAELTGCSKVVRFDDLNSRLFVVCPAIPEMSSEEIKVLIDRIFDEFDGPPDEYLVSFFSIERLAGYETDPCCKDSPKNEEWARAYLGEYYTHSETITLWPAIEDKRRVLQL